MTRASPRGAGEPCEGALEPLGPEAVKEIQLRVLDLFTAWAGERRLPWSLAAGTLLGAVRHGGFIPWDDDIDVMMPRDAFDRFCSDRHWPEGIALACSATDDRWAFPYAKLFDSSTLVQEPYRGVARAGVGIDIFPLDHWPASAMGSWALRRVLGALQAVLMSRILEPRLGRTMWKRAIVLVSRHFIPLPPQMIGRLIGALASRWTGDQGGILVWGIGESVAWTDVYPGSQLAFEGRPLPAPRSPESVLTSKYGDFMSLPPEDMRRPLHVSPAYRLPPQVTKGRQT